MHDETTRGTHADLVRAPVGLPVAAAEPTSGPVRLSIVDGVACPRCGANMGEDCHGETHEQRERLYWAIGCDEMGAQAREGE